MGKYSQGGRCAFTGITIMRKKNAAVFLPFVEQPAQGVNIGKVHYISLALIFVQSFSN